MKGAIAFLLLVTTGAFAQQAVDPNSPSHQGSQSSLSAGFPSINLFGGYSFTNIDTNGLDSRQNANGWEASVATHLLGPWAVEADGGGYYKTINAGGNPLRLNDYSIMAGPRFNFAKGLSRMLSSAWTACRATSPASDRPRRTALRRPSEAGSNFA